MIIVQNVKLNPANLTATVELFADTKTEVTDSISGLDIPTGYSIAMGSSVLTAAGEIAFRKSDGTWSWV